MITFLLAIAGIMLLVAGISLEGLYKITRSEFLTLKETHPRYRRTKYLLLAMRFIYPTIQTLATCLLIAAGIRIIIALVKL